MNNFFEKFRNKLTSEDFSKLEKNSDQVFEILMSGYDVDFSKLNKYEFSANQEISINGVSFISVCKHHLLPFFGTCSVNYISSDRIIGLSRIKEIIQTVSKKLTLQEDLTKEIFDILREILKPKMMKITIKAKHSCMMLKNLSLEEEIVTVQLL